MDAYFSTIPSVHPTASSFSSHSIDVDARSLSFNLIVPPSFSFTPSDGDPTQTHPAPSSLKTEGPSSNGADIVRAEDLPPMGISAAEGQLTIIHDRNPTVASMRSFDLLAHMPPCAFTTYSTDVFLRNLKGSPHAQEAKLVTVKRFVKKNGARHRCLVLLTRDGIGLRVDRRRDHTLSLPRFILRHGNSDATDTVTVSQDTHLLSDRRSKEEATLELPLQVLLLDFMRILEVVLDECHSYRLFGENCWFVASILEELLVDMFGARYAMGEAARLPTHLARKTRVRIRNRLGLGENV
ncbi:uncharacterized protein EI90DRAFT_3046110 [Cantharellus anzutake]|uniref:uncharacterized protein n=1 Tax=Cantharellus anzutake TaxID=1750568 RepID=UPI001904A5F4|nr:uncharacterized protein EI90DRAFT_3046110 [Cantharellus anzutake]KAF8336540.1 hypothetical protein EI90DRAFT_3046110 [Cantharellus anzutake]